MTLRKLKTHVLKGSIYDVVKDSTGYQYQTVLNWAQAAV